MAKNSNINTDATKGNFPHKHLLGIKQLSVGDIELILAKSADYFEMNRQARKGSDLLKGLTQFNLFFENSTRTLMSFEVAGKRLGLDVVDFNAATSSLKKGETLADTAQTLNAMRPAVMVIRHGLKGAVGEMCKHVNCAIINAGDGSNEHPTQALLDAATILRHKPSLKGLRISICGDIAHSRVARSNIFLLNKMGATITLVGPKNLMPDDLSNLNCHQVDDLDEGLSGADVIMMLRIQKERLGNNKTLSDVEYFKKFGLSRERLKHADPNAIVMHPGPMNRDVEISSDVADDAKYSVILEQVEMGVAVRMAILDLLTQSIR
jgi:aspartate carbamoyltransferase catalytic subunit